MKLAPALAAAALVAASVAAPVAHAADDPSCATIRLSDPGWTDITSTNAIASTLLTALGYTPDVKTLSVPIGYEAMKKGEIDVFLGNWMPAQQPFRDDLDAAKAAEVLVQLAQAAIGSQLLLQDAIEKGDDVRPVDLRHERLLSVERPPS